MKKIIVNFPQGSSAFERNRLIRLKMETQNYTQIITGQLKKQGLDVPGDSFENSNIEKADSIEIYYLVD